MDAGVLPWYVGAETGVELESGGLEQFSGLEIGRDFLGGEGFVRGDMAAPGEFSAVAGWRRRF